MFAEIDPKQQILQSMYATETGVNEKKDFKKQKLENAKMHFLLSKFKKVLVTYANLISEFYISVKF